MRSCFLLLLAAACDPAVTDTDTGSSADSDSGTDTDTGPVDDADDPDHAVALSLDDPRGDTLHDDDEDWWSVTGTAGQQFRIQVVNDDENGSDESLDTVVEVYDAALTRIAWEDDHPVGDVAVYDTVCFGFFPADGTYYVRVTDRGVFDGAPRAVDSTDYEVTFLSPSGVPDEPDSLLSIDLEYAVDTDNSWYAIPVLAETAGDVDYAKLVMPHADGTIFIEAAQHIESSPYLPEITLYDADAAAVLGPTRLGPDDGRQLVAPLGTQYELAVTDAWGGWGPNVGAWIFVANAEEGYGYPREVEPNDATAGAPELELYDQEPDAGSWFAGGAEGRIGTAGDVDVWSVTLPEDAYVSVDLGALWYGGLLTAEVTLHQGDTPLATAAADGGVDPALATEAKVAAGTYTVSVRSTDAAAGGEGQGYRLVLHATSVPR